MSAVSLRQTKNALRKEMKTILSKLLESEKVTKSASVVQEALSNDHYIKSQRVSVFLSMSDEIDTLPLVKDILANKSCFIPYYNGPEMSMLELKSWDDYVSLPETKWKIKQPSDTDKENRNNALKSGGLDLIFVPGLAFTESGKRLGRGKGYYDKFLRECIESGSKPVTIGLAFKDQICTDVPVSEEDFVLNEVIYST